MSGRKCLLWVESGHERSTRLSSSSLLSDSLREALRLNSIEPRET
jgi:hypothetical protein